MSSFEPRTGRECSPVADYFAATRGPWYGFLFALPILVCYELLELILRPPWTNGADAILSNTIVRALAELGAVSRSTVMLVLLVVAGVVSFAADRARRGDQPCLKPRYFVGMLAESCIYGLLFGSVVSALTAQLLHPLQMGGHGPGLLGGLTMALGAGIYEELLFRVLLMGGVMALLVRGFKLQPVAAWVGAVLVSSIIFSAFHHLGSMGEPFTVQAFTFRFIAGAVLATLYAARGFGIAVWTHALYDVLVMVFLPFLT